MDFDLFEIGVVHLLSRLHFWRWIMLFPTREMWREGLFDEKCQFMIEGRCRNV